MDFKREHSLLNKLIVVDGIGKSGKSLLLGILSCFHGVEKQDYYGFLEYISLAHKYGKISDDMATAILKTEMDTKLYNQMIGREINTRLSDDTSLYKYHTPSKYLKRALEEDGSIVYEKVLSEKPICVCWSHDLINKSDIIFQAFEKALHLIYVNRNPIHIVHDWNKANYSIRMANDPTERQYCIKFKNTTVPEIALGWEEEFLSISPLERTIKLIYTSFKRNRDALIQKQKYNNIDVINFEDILTKPDKVIWKLKQIIGNDISSHIDKLLVRENCPRTLNNVVTFEIEEILHKNVSIEYRGLLNEMNRMYDEIALLSKQVSLDTA